MKIIYSHRSPKSFLGRFGGCWQWKLGLQASEGFKEIIISLFVAELRIKFI